MNNSFILFHDACWQLRQLLIAAQCLEHEVKLHTKGGSKNAVSILLPLMEDMEVRCLTIANTMHQFISEIQASERDLQLHQAFASVESSCHDLLGAVVEVVRSSSKIAGDLLNDKPFSKIFDDLEMYIGTIQHRMIAKS